MQTTLVFSHMEENAQARAVFTEKSDKAAKYLKRFKEDQTALHGALDKNPHKNEFYASLTLYLPSVTLHVRERGPEYGAAFSKAFLALGRQAKKHNDKLNREKRRTSRASSRP
ncbi:MAG: HPF/RaiA family ribosome-associated protein [Deltaproteobacteria bacterium]